MLVQVERHGDYYWVIYYVDNTRVDESGPYTEAWEAYDVAERA